MKVSIETAAIVTYWSFHYINLKWFKVINIQNFSFLRYIVNSKADHTSANILIKMQHVSEELKHNN